MPAAFGMAGATMAALKSTMIPSEQLIGQSNMLGTHTSCKFPWPHL